MRGKESEHDTHFGSWGVLWRSRPLMPAQQAADKTPLAGAIIGRCPVGGMHRWRGRPLRRWPRLPAR